MSGDVTGKHGTTWTYMRNTVTGEVVALRRGTRQGRIDLNRMHQQWHPLIWHKPLWEQQFSPPPADPPPP